MYSTWRVCVCVCDTLLVCVSVTLACDTHVYFMNNERTTKIQHQITLCVHLHRRQVFRAKSPIVFFFKLTHLCLRF